MQHLDPADHGVERRAQLVRQQAEEFVFGAAGFLGLLSRCLLAAQQLLAFRSIKRGQLIFNRPTEIEAGLPAMCRVRTVGRSGRSAIFVLYQIFQNSIRCLLLSKSRIRDAKVVYATCKE